MVKEEVTADDIAEVVASWTGIPAGRLLEGETQKLLRMEDELGKRVVGQAEAVREVSDAVRRARAGISDPNRPTGSFLFLGPTGVGKTELAKALAEFLFDEERAMVRIDMSEYSEKHSVSRLAGAPPGYVGYEEGGQLTEAVRRRPYSVILLDEVEKAHPEVFDILLQVLDDGRPTDGQGRTVDFRNVILILTSNSGSQFLIDTEMPYEQRRELVLQVVRQQFRPEFLNRLDGMVMFEPLNREQLAKVADIQIAQLQQRLDDRRITLTVSPEATAWLVERGFDPVYGARPLRRLVQTAVGDKLARGILSGEIRDGSAVLVGTEPDGTELTPPRTVELFPGRVLQKLDRDRGGVPIGRLAFPQAGPPGPMGCALAGGGAHRQNWEAGQFCRIRPGSGSTRQGWWWPVRGRRDGGGCPRPTAPAPRARVDRPGAFRDGAVAQLVGDVVVVALEGAVRDPEPRRERMQLLDRGVAHQVRPEPPAPRPDRVVDEDGHLSRRRRRRAPSAEPSASASCCSTPGRLQNAQRT